MRGNPLHEIIPDDLFYKLKTKGFLNERAVRDFYMKKRFEDLKKEYPPKKIFSLLQQEFPYLSVDTVRKIIYSKNGIHYS